MQTLQYTIIKNDKQYNKYCNALELLNDEKKKTKSIKDEIELLTLLIEKYDEANNSFELGDPIELLRLLMKEHRMKSVELANFLNVSEGLVSDMINYKKGLSKEVIRKLAEKFKVSQEAFNRPYMLESANIAIPAKANSLKAKKELNMA
jgi:HTH-type transcriptional regulator / antitoxin HigA